MRLFATGLLACACATLAQDATRAFTSEACGVAFEYPSDWVVRADSSDWAGPCGFSLRPIAWDSLLIEADSVDRHTVVVRVVEEPFESVAAERGFERRGQEWIVLGRHGMEAPAAPIEDPRWQEGVRGTRVGGCYRLNAGGYAGICGLPAAVIGTNQRSISLDTEPLGEDVLDLILRTIRFSRPGISVETRTSWLGWT